MTKFTAGIDEVGRGPLVGPVTAACVVFPNDYTNDSITVSKKGSEKKRQKLFIEITENCLVWSVISVGPRRIEALNIRGATKLAMALAARRSEQLLARKFSSFEMHYLIDGNMPVETLASQETIIKGDSKEMCIGAASIIAKVTRDGLMPLFDKHYPGYDFAKHKGYPTTYHRQKLSTLVSCTAQRRTFSGVREFFPS